MAVLIQQAIDRFPHSVDLRVIDSYVQISKLKNEFKAMFDMMNSELCQPNLFE